jgi:transcription-repair coupling factor (superfamily II helicase)
VLKIDAGPKLMTITFRPNPPIDAMAIISLVQRQRHVKLAGNDKLRIEREVADPRERAQMVRDLLRSLGTPTATSG